METSEQVIRQSNELISAKYKINQNELKIIHIGIFVSQDNDFRDRVVIPADLIDELLPATNFKGLAGELKKIANSLMSRTIDIPSKKGSFELAHWIHNAKYDADLREFSFEWDSKIVPHLGYFKNGDFTQLELQFTMHMNVYSIRLYQFLKKDVWKSKGLSVVTVSLAEKNEKYKFLGDVLGYKGKSYSVWANVRRRIVEPSVKEITDKTDIKIVSVEGNKVGRKVTTVTITYMLKSAKEIEQLIGATNLDAKKLVNEETKGGNNLITGMFQQPATTQLVEKGTSRKTTHRQAINTALTSKKAPMRNGKKDKEELRKALRDIENIDW